VSATASATVNAHNCSISLTKTPNKTDVCSSGYNSVTYTYVVKNTGDFFDASGSVSDDLLGSIGSFGPLAPGASATLTKTATITTNTTNTGTATGTSGGVSVSATATATVNAHNCSISLTKTPDKADVCSSDNNSVTYTYVVKNTGDFFAASGSVTDNVLGSIGSFGPLAPGDSATLTKSATVTTTTTNTGTASGTSGGATVSATATATVTTHNCSISLTKTPNKTDVCSGSSTSVTYTYVVKNTGNFFDASGSVTDDVLGSIGSFGPLAPGASATLTKTANVGATTTNTGTATGTSGGASVSATASATVTAHNCSISLTKTPSATAVCNGASVTYTFVVTNNSDKYSWSGSLTDDVLGTIAASITLAPGGSQTFTKSATINGTVTNTGTASGTFNDSTSASASKTATATVYGQVCRIIVKKVTNPTGDPATFAFSGSLVGSIGDGGMITRDVTAPGTYSTTEAVPTGWDLTGIVCTDPTNNSSGSSATATYNVALGETVSCTFTNRKRGVAKVIKTFNGGALGTNTFTFQLRSGASASQAGTTLETLIASSGNNGTLNFTTQLVPGQTYQMCEQMQPGWMTTLGPPLYSVFNPSGDNSVVCTDFTVNAGETKTFTINNQPPPGGMGLTIGFWKNWSSCTGGGQKPTLDKTLQLADIVLGSLTLHDSNPDVNVASDCQAAYNLLNKSTVTKGTKMSSDPIFNMVAQLLAADLNVLAGAGQSTTVISLRSCAHALLTTIHFNGNTYDKLTAAQISQANCLATQLDNYNNNRSVTACPNCP
jgi:hypothetical protein